jgi:hypothetical protein
LNNFSLVEYLIKGSRIPLPVGQYRKVPLLVGPSHAFQCYAPDFQIAWLSISYMEEH